MCPRECLDTDEAAQKPSEKLQQLRPPQLLANHCRAGGVDAVDLKDSLGDIQPDRANLHGGWLLSLWRSATTTLWHLDAGEQGVAVGTEITLRPPHRSRRALLTHRAPALDGDGEPLFWPRVEDSGGGEIADSA